MKYSEVIEKVRRHEAIPRQDVSGFHLLLLMRDKEITNINYYGNVFEVNFIPIAYAFEAHVLKEEELSTVTDGEKIIEHWVHCYDVKKSIYVQIEDEYFEIKLELLEST